MSAKSRGGASVAALVVATLILLASVWFAFAGPGAETAPAKKRNARQPGSGSPAGHDQLVRADDLLQRMNRGFAPPEASEGLILYRPKPDRPPPENGHAGLASVTGRLDGFSVLLQWEPGTGAAPGGYLVEQVNESGDAGSQVKVGEDVRSLMCAPVDALTGGRLYRVTVLAADGSVVAGSAREKLVSWEIGSEIDYLGPGPTKGARFRVRLPGFEPGDDAVREFTVAPGGVIGERLAAAGQMPDLDWSTGYVFRTLRGRRREKTENVKVPRFGRDGRIVKSDSGETEYVDRELTVSEVVMQAMILRPGAPDDVRWLPETKD